MTEGKGPLDGFGMPPEPTSAGTVIYGGAPNPYPWIPDWPVLPGWPYPQETSPPQPPTFIIPAPKPNPKRILEVTEDGQTVFLATLTDEAWVKVRAAVAEALK